MSALPNSSASPGPQRAESLVPVPPFQRPARSSRWIIAMAVLMVALAAVWVLRPQQSARPVVDAVRTVKAVRGVLQRTVRVTGTVAAVQARTIFAPVLQVPDSGRGQVLISLAPNGSLVKEGQVIAEIDGQSILDHLEDVESQVGQVEMDMRKLKAQQAATRQNIEQRVLVARANLEKARQDVRASDVKNAIQREQLKLAVEEAQANYDEARRQVGMLAERQAAEWSLAEMSQQAQIRHLNRHRSDYAHMTIRAPIDGQVVMQTLRRGTEMAQVRLGDELSPAQPFMKVVDLSKMQVSATMNQSDSELVRLGQRANVHFDAYPGMVLPGRVEAVGALAVSGRRMSYFVHNVSVRIAIEKSDALVIPDLTASAEVVVAEQDGALLIPREAVQESGGKSMVFVKQGDTLTAREVGIGEYGSTQVSVTSGLEAGDEIVIK